MLDESSPKDWTNAELNSLINTKYHDIHSKVVNVFEDYYLTTDTFDSVEDQQEYGSSDGLPTDILKLRRVELNYDADSSSSKPTRCLPMPLDAERRDLAQTNSGGGVASFSSAHYYAYGFGSDMKLGFIPVPTKDGTDAIKIWYVQEAVDLSSDSDTLNIPYADKYWMLIVYGAVADALRFGQQDSPEADKFDAKFTVGMNQMQEDLEDRVAEETKTVMDVSGDYLNFDQ